MCRQRRRQRLLTAAAEPDLEQPLLLRNGSSTVVEPIKEVPEAASHEGGAFSWWDASMQATLAAVLCLWALKLVQQGYVDGESANMSVLLHLPVSLAFVTAGRSRGLPRNSRLVPARLLCRPVPSYQDALVAHCPLYAFQKQKSEIRAPIQRQQPLSDRCIGAPA